MGRSRALRAHAWAAAVAAAAVLAAAVSATAGSPTIDPSIPANHQGDPIILTGADFPGWAAPANVTAKAPGTDLATCHPTVDPTKGTDPNNWTSTPGDCSHNGYAQPEVDTKNALGDGAPVDRILGYRWNAASKQFEQIPFQIDKMFTRYLDNSASGFSIYSGQDQHTTYQFDREGFRYYKEDPANPCHALPDGPPATDPVKGLDTNDELAFMASDAGAQAPSNATLPAGIDKVREVRVDDPQNPGATTYAYVMLAKADGPKPAFDASNGYVKYTRDPSADTFQFSQSNYKDYGNARKGHFMWDGKCVGATPEEVKNDPERCVQPDGSPIDGPGQANKRGETDAFLRCPQRHRPGDAATISTSRYQFRYDGRWLLTGLHISPDGGQTYGPNLIDRWKARAFAQDPYSKTPCCGYEDEDKNWGGSSTLLGERTGPVRTIRETWGADSGTNVVRRETFYRDGMRQKTYLRVHVIPPLDGIYAQWDFSAGQVDKYFNPRVANNNPNFPKGYAPVDGKNDEVFGNLDDPCTGIWDGNSRSPFDQTYRDMYKQLQLCTPPCSGSGQCLPLNKYHQSVDLTDPTFANLNASLDWNEVSGPHGTVVDRYQLEKVTDTTPGGTPQTLFAMPYYRDDSCFDDGTGSNPGPRLIPRSTNEPRTYTAPDGTTHPRTCWKPSDGVPKPGDPRYFQGDIGTHGLHLLLIAESDNARQTVPVTEVVSEQRLAFLPGDQGNVGEQYGRSFEKPLVATTADYTGTQPSDGGGTPSGGGTPPSGDPGSGHPSNAGSNGGTPEGSATPTPRSSGAVQGQQRRSAKPSCLSRAGRAGARGIGRVRIGQSSARIIRELGRPAGVGNSAFRWCVAGGGKLAVVFNAKGRARLIVTTSRRTIASARRVRSPLVRVGKRGRVRYVAVIDRGLARSARELRRFLALA